MLELNNIYNEDCLEGLKKIDTSSIDSIVSDPALFIIIYEQRMGFGFAISRNPKRMLACAKNRSLGFMAYDTKTGQPA